MRRKRSSLPGVVMLALLLVGATGAAEPGASGTPHISFKGRVLDGRGRPIPDVKVVLYEVNYGGSTDLPKATQVKEIVTGPDGAFLFTTAKGSEGYKQGSIIARKEGLALGWAVWNMHEGDQQSDIPLGESKELSGAVVDEGDSPIVDADVSVAIAIIGSEQDRRYLTYFVAPELLTVRTDSTGRFVFPNLPQEATCEFLAKMSGRGTTCTFDPASYRGEKCQFSPGQAGIKLTLPVEARIEGIVVQKTDGKPLGSVWIVAQPDQRGLPFTMEPVTAAPDGTFFIGNLTAGGYTVQLPQGQGTADWVAEPVKLNLKAGETVRDVRLALSKGGLLEVFVKEDKSGKPVEKASISIRNEAQNQWLSGMTDANGLAHIRLYPGSYQLSGIYKQDYARSEQGEAFTLAEGETKRFEQTLGGLPTVSGVVYDDAGKPLEGATVQILPGGRSKTAVSDAGGKFQVSWDPQGWPPERTVFCLIARHLDRGLAAAQPVDEDSKQIEIKLRPAATLTGQVVDPNGKGIEGADLVIMFQASSWGSTFLPSRSVRTNAEGKFEAPTVPAEQRYGVTASADRFGQVRIEVTEDKTIAGRVEVGSFALPLANLSVSGVVVDSQGKPVPGARISCYGRYEDNQPNRDTVADAEGKFTLDEVCAGRISISANAQSGGVNLNGYIQTEGGARDIQLVISERSSSTRYVPRRPASLKGKSLPDLKKLGIEPPADANDHMLLVCFWDMNQRPSRYCMGELIRRAPQLAEKGVTLVAVHSARLEQGALEQWIEQNKPSFPVTCLADKIEETQFEWGVASLPHLILTDKQHVVVGEGFGMLGELDKRIEEASGQ